MSERWPPSNRNAGRLAIGTLAALASETVAAFSRNLHLAADRRLAGLADAPARLGPAGSGSHDVLPAQRRPGGRVGVGHDERAGDGGHRFHWAEGVRRGRVALGKARQPSAPDVAKAALGRRSGQRRDPRLGIDVQRGGRCLAGRSVARSDRAPNRHSVGRRRLRRRARLPLRGRPQPRGGGDHPAARDCGAERHGRKRSQPMRPLHSEDRRAWTARLAAGRPVRPPLLGRGGDDALQATDRP